MNLFELFVKIGVDDQASDHLSQLSGKLGSGLQTAAKIGTAAIAAAATGIGVLTYNAIQQYAEYEQLIGGVETLFKNNADTVKKYAENAYMTAGMDANRYMEVVTSFSASLISSLGNDTAAAAEYGNQALIDMADNANKMGTSMETIVATYQSLSRGNFAMLDNLKLGYGGTRAEMERLIADANAVKEANGEMADLSIDSFADMVEAIHIVQNEMGISGATAAEAAETISGSLMMTKAAWSNLVTGIANDNADFQELIDNFVESVSIAGENILPRVEIALNGVANLIDSLFPVIIERIPAIIEDILPKITTAAVKVVESLINGISQNSDSLMTTVVDTVMIIVNGIIDLLPEIVRLGLEVIVALANGIAQALPELVPAIVDVVFEIVDILTDPAVLENLVKAAVAINLAIASGIIKSIPTLIKKMPKLIKSLATYLSKAAVDLIKSGAQFVVNIIDGIVSKTADLIKSGVEIVINFVSGISSNVSSLISQGIIFVENIISGIVSKMQSVQDKGSELVQKIKDGISGRIGDILDQGIKIVTTLGDGISSVIGTVKTHGATMIANIVSGIAGAIGNITQKGKDIVNSFINGARSVISTVKDIGTNIVDGVWKGIQNAKSKFVSNVTKFFSGIVNSVKKVLGINSPSKVFATIGASMVEGLGLGWEKNFPAFNDNVVKSMNFDAGSIGISSFDNFANGNGGRNISSVSVTQNIYSEAKTAADLMQEAIYQQERAVLLGV